MYPMNIATAKLVSASPPAAPTQREARDQRRDVVHAIEQHAPVATTVAGEDRLPYGCAQTSRRHRSTEDVPEGVVESPPYLEPPRE
jgi:hypothetical protein